MTEFRKYYYYYDNAIWHYKGQKKKKDEAVSGGQNLRYTVLKKEFNIEITFFITIFKPPN